MRRFKMRNELFRIRAIANYWVILSNLLTFACNARPLNDHGIPGFGSTNLPHGDVALMLAVNSTKEGTVHKWEGLGGLNSARGIPTVGGRRGRYLQMSAGSSPAHCLSKCGDCIPCTPVQIRIQPAILMSANEYYPEAWRCTCRRKIYMP